MGTGEGGWVTNVGDERLWWRSVAAVAFSPPLFLEPFLQLLNAVCLLTSAGFWESGMSGIPVQGQLQCWPGANPTRPCMLDLHLLDCNVHWRTLGWFSKFHECL